MLQSQQRIGHVRTSPTHLIIDEASLPACGQRLVCSVQGHYFLSVYYLDYRH